MRTLPSSDRFHIPDAGVVLDTQVDVLGDTETEVAGLGEVALAELVLLDLEATLEDLLSLGAADGDVDGDLLVTADTEGTDGVAGLGVDGGLTRQLLEHLGGTSEPVTRLADGDVEDELLDAELPHGVGGLGVGLALRLALAAVLLSSRMAGAYHGDCYGCVSRGCREKSVGESMLEFRELGFARLCVEGALAPMATGVWTERLRTSNIERSYDCRARTSSIHPTDTRRKGLCRQTLSLIF
jgi:hypothetical protein